jgi:TetR/AcrR family transcriptional repressor of nem operon
MPDSTRDKIIQTAARLFHEQGYHATGVSTLLREAGLNSGSLYHFFPSKEHILLAVLEDYKERLHPVVMAPAEAAQPDDPIERIFELLRWYRGVMEQTGCRLGCPVGNLALELSDNMEAARVEIDANMRAWSGAIEAWLNEAGDRLPSSCDRAGLSRFVLTVMEGGLLQCRSAQSLEPFDDSVAQLRAYVDCLLAQADRERDCAQIPPTPSEASP